MVVKCNEFHLSYTLHIICTYSIDLTVKSAIKNLFAVRQAFAAESFSVMSVVHGNIYKSEWTKNC